MKLKLTTGRGTRAFTLVEMILAIGCAAIVLVAINAAFFGGLRWRNTTQGLVDDASPVDLALSTLRHDLQGVVPPSSDGTGIMTGAFKAGDISSTDIGDLVNLEFHTTTGALQENSPWGDIQRVTYSLQQPASRNDSGNELIRTVTRNLLGSGTVESARHWVMSGVDRISIQCYDGNQWQETWDTTALTSVNTNLPFAVRVKIQLTHGNSGVFTEQPIQIVVPINTQSRTNRTGYTES